VTLLDLSTLDLKYKGKTRQPIIRNLTRVSKPGLRVYSNRKELPRVLGGIGIAIISTSSGIMTDRDARRQGLAVKCFVMSGSKQPAFRSSQVRSLKSNV
jgi:small subunit ribosomal protein S8